MIWWFFAKSKLNGAAMTLLLERSRASSLFHRRANNLAKKGEGLSPGERSEMDVRLLKILSEE